MSSVFWSLPGWLAQDSVQGDWWALDGLIPPVDEPVTINDAKVQARADGNSRDDVSFAGFIATARLLVERYTNRSLLPQTWKLSLQQWPTDRIYLPRAPLIGLSSFTYTDINQVISSVPPGVYTVNLSGDPGSVVKLFGQIWPPPPVSPSAPIQLIFQAGYPRFAGLANIDATGLIVTAAGSPVTLFDPTWTANQWIVINGITSVIASVDSSGTFLTLMSPCNYSGALNVPWNVNLVPTPLKTAILMLATHFYGPGRAPVVVGRGVTSAEISLTAKAMMDPYRINVMGFTQTFSRGISLWP